MIELIGIGLALAHGGDGHSQRFYGPTGQSIGTSTTIDRTTTFYGPDGRKTGSATSTGTATTFYGANGEVVGHSYGN